ncbi:mannose PTS, EII [Carnobacterium sp. 17-4]|uniref:metallophosphoesterase n=1 Tax=Carnobacterium sp. (strain 17-4) TaxID=208596 RepID=UPI0002058E80|nr:metallophosphoesterase [Carnobacterium sp. 17-4]AEB29064.1 mannose PTS, EII [Carnobacterium sp. 17-4]
MKIGVLSDLHIDTNKKKLNGTETFANIIVKQINHQNIDVLLIAGDISSDYLVSQQFIDEVTDKSGIPILFVPGNHDFWSLRNGETDTKKIYRFFENQPDSLLNKPYILNDEWAVVGNGGWYDYGYANQGKYTKSEFDDMKLRVGVWQDKRYVHWGEGNKQVAQWMLDKLEADLQSVGNRKVILMTHVVTHPKFVVSLPHKIYDYFNAFLGSSSYEKLYKNYPIVYSIMGHVHFRKTLVEDQVNYICACLGGSKHWLTKDPEAEVVNALLTFQLPERTK